MKKELKKSYAPGGIQTIDEKASTSSAKCYEK
jgi:hypothetical protein